MLLSRNNDTPPQLGLSLSGEGKSVRSRIVEEVDRTGDGGAGWSMMARLLRRSVERL